MKTQNNLGIWMDHSTAQLIEVNSKKSNRSIFCDFNSEVKEEALNRSEDIMHNKRQQMQEGYYKEIGKEILNYDHVLLFGPTNAKVELNNYLDKGRQFKNVKIEVKPADKMSENQQQAFVESYFKTKN